MLYHFIFSSMLRLPPTTTLFPYTTLFRSLQLAGERLRLLEEVLRSHVRLERVEHDADGFGELIQERQVRRVRSEEHTSELQSPCNLVCRLLLEKKKKRTDNSSTNHLKK